MSNQSDTLKLINCSAQADKRYVRIINALSHKLRTQLSVIKLNMQLFKIVDLNANDIVKDQSISLCEESIENILELMEDVQLVNSKSDLFPSYSTFSLEEILNKQFSKLEKYNLDSSRIIYDKELLKKSIRCDKIFFQKIVRNVLANALKFSSKEVLLAIIDEGEFLNIIVKDYGVGIPEEEFESVFDPFQMASNTKHNSESGLGLAVVNKLTTIMRGKVYMASKIGLGTTVKIIIPHDASNRNFSN